MKIYINQIPSEGLFLKEEVSASALDLETDIIKFRGNIKIAADVSKITNAVTVKLSLGGLMYSNCSRCLNEFETGFSSNFQLNYAVNKTDQVIDLGPDIRDQVILNYPIKPLCNADCKGLCPKCGKNLNEGGCSCGST